MFSDCMPSLLGLVYSCRCLWVHSTDSSGNPINSAANGVGGQQMQRQQQMQMRPYSYDSRLNAVETLESTVLELGTIMQELASMVDEQEHLVARYAACHWSPALGVQHPC